MHVGSQLLSCQKVTIHLIMSPEREKRLNKFQSNVDFPPLISRRARVLCRSLKSLLEKADCFQISRFGLRAQASPATIDQGLRPVFGMKSVMCQKFNLVGQLNCPPFLDRGHYQFVQLPAPPLQQRVVGHVMDQVMAKAVLQIRHDPGAFEETSVLQPAQMSQQFLARHMTQTPEQSDIDPGPNHRGAKKYCFLDLRQRINTCRKYSVYAARNLQVRYWNRWSVAAGSPNQPARLRQGSQALFEEEGIALGFADEKVLEFVERRVRPQELLE